MTEITLFRSAEEAEAFAQGQVIFREGENGSAMYVVSEGEIELSIHDQIVETVGPGGIFGEMALIDHRPRSATATARTPARIQVIDEKRFQFLVQQTPFFALQVMRIMAERLRRMDSRLAPAPSARSQPD